MKNIFIGGAWPYANGSLHIGHISALLPGDVLARYYRAKIDYLKNKDIYAIIYKIIKLGGFL
nr:class I tRNA ligase family protein [Clostridium intestinale]